MTESIQTCSLSIMVFILYYKWSIAKTKTNTAISGYEAGKRLKKIMLDLKKKN